MSCRKEVPLYEPALWGMVFPLGMYTTATFQLSRATHFEFLVRIPEVFIFVALAAWFVAFAGLLRHLWSSLGQDALARMRNPSAAELLLRILRMWVHGDESGRAGAWLTISTRERTVTRGEQMLALRETERCRFPPVLPRRIRPFFFGERPGR